jgi:hypothetical protein
VKAKGLKIQIEEFVVGKTGLREEVSAWELLQTPLKSWK